MNWMVFVRIIAPHWWNKFKNCSQSVTLKLISGLQTNPLGSGVWVCVCMWVILKQFLNNWMPKHFTFVFFVSAVRKVCIFMRMFQILHSLQLKMHMGSLIYISLMTDQGHRDQGCKAAYWKQVTSIIIRHSFTRVRSPLFLLNHLCI